MLDCEWEACVKFPFPVSTSQKCSVCSRSLGEEWSPRRHRTCSRDWPPASLEHLHSMHTEPRSLAEPRGVLSGCCPTGLRRTFSLKAALDPVCCCHRCQSPRTLPPWNAHMPSSCLPALEQRILSCPCRILGGFTSPAPLSPLSAPHQVLCPRLTARAPSARVPPGHAAPLAVGGWRALCTSARPLGGELCSGPGPGPGQGQALTDALARVRGGHSFSPTLPRARSEHAWRPPPPRPAGSRGCLSVPWSLLLRTGHSITVVFGTQELRQPPSLGDRLGFEECRGRNPSVCMA